MKARKIARVVRLKGWTEVILETDLGLRAYGFITEDENEILDSINKLFQASFRRFKEGEASG